MKKCPACNTDCVPLVGGDGQEHLGHVTGPDGNFPACPILSGEMAEAQERARLSGGIVLEPGIDAKAIKDRRKRALDGSVIAAEELISDDVPALLLAIKRLTIERDSLRHHVDSLEHMSVRAMKELAQTRGELEQARQEREQIRQIGRGYEIALRKALSDLLETHEDEPERPSVANALKVMAHRIPVIINARTVLLDGPSASYPEIVSKVMPLDYEDVVTVTYCKGPWGQYEGTLSPGQRVQLKDGMLFSVTDTGRA